MQNSELTGILLMDKPQGFTSHDVVAKLRGILHTRKIGHGGTLDPLATGVLPVFVGGATKAADFAAAQDKEYVAGFTLGYCTMISRAGRSTSLPLRARSYSFWPFTLTAEYMGGTCCCGPITVSYTHLSRYSTS